MQTQSVLGWLWAWVSGGAPARRQVVAAILGTIVGASLLGVTPVTAAKSPNSSIILYRPGKAFLGTLAGGAFVRTGSFSTRGWTDIAVGRDTLVMYRKRDGKLTTARFRDGRVTSRTTTYTGPGFTHVAASCDTVLFYKKGTGRAWTAPIKDGRVRLGKQRSFKLASGFKLVEASCRTAFLLAKDNGKGNVQVKSGTLKDGRYEKKPGSPVIATPTHVAATDDSFNAVDVPDMTGIWGTAVGGVLTHTGSAFDFASFWDIIAGSADTLFFYDRRAPQAAVSTLSGGAYWFIGGATPVPSGITIIAGGR